MNNPIEVSLLSHFEGVEDPRDNLGKEHNLLDIIVIAICAVISRAIWKIKTRMAGDISAITERDTL